MGEYFFGIVKRLTQRLRGGEILLCNLAGEASHFVRFNRSRIRQAGHVRRSAMQIELLDDSRHAAARVELSGDPVCDLERLTALLGGLREQCAQLPEDPYLNYARDAGDSLQQGSQSAPDSRQVVEQISTAAEGLDLVGIWASGSLYRGFANSFGQRNWFSNASFHLDWSCYAAADKAVKATYSGAHWDPACFAARLEAMRSQLQILAQPAKTVPPGRYRVYLAPAAMQEILDLMSWGGFSLKSQRTGQTPLLKMVRQGKCLHPSVWLREDNTRGLGPSFTTQGFHKPAQVSFVADGTYREPLVDARSGKEYGVPVNASVEAPEALDMAAGALPAAAAVEQLGRGLYLGNLWYGNFSERNDCRITGMTRFASFWVERGEICAPLSPLRFDDSVYHLLGDRLQGLTCERELRFSGDTYGGRSTHSSLLPGALIEGMEFTL